MAKFQIVKDVDKGYKFYLRLDSGDVVLNSETTSVSKDVCEKQIEQVKANSKFAHRFSRLAGTDGSYFILKDAEGQVLGHSNEYSYWLDMERSIAAIRSYAGDASVEELSLAEFESIQAGALDLVND